MILLGWAIAGYAALGLLFAIPFLIAGVDRLPRQTVSIPARLLLLPGSIVVWPVLIGAWRRARKEVRS
ncbi:MAG: hypothetical protein RL885_15135 [Planctomycetota bacterium]